MSLVNHTIKNISQGVSEQHEEARHETQVSEMINCIPDISRGVFRRNPVLPVISSNIPTHTPTTKYFSYSYERGDGEKYAVYISEGTVYVYDLLTATQKLAYTSPYLTVNSTDTYPNTYDSFAAFTVGDFTFISNKNTVVSSTSNTPTNIHKRAAIYWIKNVTSVSTLIQTQASTTESKQVSNFEGYTYKLNTKEVKAERTYTWNGSAFVLSTDILTADKIADEVATLSTEYEAVDGFVYWKGATAPTSWDWGDNLGGTASFGWNGEVSDAAELPAVIPDTIVDYYNTIGGLYVYITGGSSDGIGYWLKYSKGVGWEESTEPGMEAVLDYDTMPHVLVRGSDGVFSFITYDNTSISAIPGIVSENLGWKDREVGDLTTAPLPSFVGSTITQLLFYKNRLGLISYDNILLSEANNYGNFFPTTVRTLVDSDPIDLTVAGEDVSILRYAVTLSDALILFSDDTQYLLTAGDVLSPNTVGITVASRYNITPRVKPIVIGDSAFFMSSIGDSERLYKYSLSNTIENKFVATDVSLHTPTYLQGITSKIIGHSTIGYVFMIEHGSNTVYVYNGTTIGEKEAQLAIHKWVFGYNIVGASIVDNTLYLTYTKEGTTGMDLFVSSISLNTPTVYSNIDYTDKYTTTIEELYESSIELSEWQVKQEDFGTSRGRLQIRTIEYSTDSSSKHSTILTNTDLIVTAFTSPITTGMWDDDVLWNDAAPWSDTGYKFSRVYTDDNRITVMGNSKNTNIVFKESETAPTKGFNLKTINYEGLFYQRSQRY